MTAILFPHSTTAGNVPASVASGELRPNIPDRVLYRRSPSGGVEGTHFNETLLAAGTVSNAASLVLQLPTTFGSFRIHYEKAFVTKSDVDDYWWMCAAFSSNGGSTWKTDAKYGSIFLVHHSTTPFYSYDGNPAGTACELGFFTSSPPAADEAAAGDIFLDRYQIGANWRPLYYCENYLWGSGAGAMFYRSTGWYNASLNVNAIKLYSYDGFNINMNYALYGVAIS